MYSRKRMMSNELRQIRGQMAQCTYCTLYSIVLVGVGMPFISSASTEESQQSYAYQKTKTAMQINMHTDLLIIATPSFCVHENINISSVYLYIFVPTPQIPRTSREPKNSATH